MNITRTSPSTRRRRRVTVRLAMALVLTAVGVAAGATTPASASPGPVDFTISTPANGAHYSIGQYLLANYKCEVDGFTLASDICVGTVPLGARIDTSTPGTKTFQVQASYARNTYYSDPVTYYVDPPVTTPPSVTISSPVSNTVYDRSLPPLASYSCTAGSFPIKSCIGTDRWSSGAQTKDFVVPFGTRVPALAGNHTFTVVATDTAGKTASATRTFTIIIRHRPDLIIATKGNDIYDSITPQTLTLTRAAHVVAITVQNDGNILDRYKLKGDGPQTVIVKFPLLPPVPITGWNVRYYESGNCAGCLGRDITTWVVAGTYLTGSISPTGHRTYYMRVIPSPYASRLYRGVAVTDPTDPRSHDAVRAILT